MNAPHRPSILSRPRLKDGGRANVENFDSEWAAEEARRAAKTRRAAAVEERMDHACYATHEERRQAWGPAQREAAQLAAARADALAAADGREAAWLAQPQTVVLDTQRPWNAASSTYYMPREVEEAAHRRGQQAAADVNRHTAQLRAVQKVQQRAAEQDALRRDYEAEVRGYRAVVLRAAVLRVV
ncbi:hypothetical protein D9Q98_007445 [Chlorella vulgaris]|uniref:Uncharacterized protein n=1 Tax=Chlorella vulgaris TaxID=3077 RepID=A0A9D4YVI3_CHLVU|nr:hypothetical protein D9Q98_007445 [Chlorella vulgaris]